MQFSKTLRSNPMGPRISGGTLRDPKELTDGVDQSLKLPLAVMADEGGSWEFEDSKHLPEPEEEVEIVTALPSDFSPDGQEALDGFLAFFATQDTPLAGQFTQGTLKLEAGLLRARYRSGLFITRFQEGSEARNKLDSALKAFFAAPVRWRSAPL